MFIVKHRGLAGLTRTTSTEEGNPACHSRYLPTQLTHLTTRCAA